VGSRLEAADAGGGWSLDVLLWCGDWQSPMSSACRAHDMRMICKSAQDFEAFL
jgi:hypothetical protein